MARPALAAAQHVQFRHFGIDDGLPSSQVTDVLRDRRGYMWIGTAHGISKFDSHRFRTYGVGADGGLPEGLIKQVFEDHSAGIWAVTASGLSRYSSASDAFTTFLSRDLGIEAARPPELTSVLEDASRRLLLGSSHGLLVLDRATGRARRLPLRASGEEWNPPINALHLGRGGRLWIGTDLGLFSIEPGSEEASRWLHVMGAGDASDDSVIRALATDKQGNLWIGTGYAGVARLDPASGRFTRYQHSPSHPDSVSGNRIARIIAEQDGSGVWIAVENGGIDRFDPRQNSFRHIRSDPSNPYSLGSNAVWALFQDPEGLLWVGTFSAGLNVSMPNGTAIRHYRSLPADEGSLSFNAVSGFLADREGIVWVGTDGGGLNRFDPGTERFVRFTSHNTNLNSDAVLSIAQGRNGELWLSTWAGGISRFDPVARRFDAYTTKNSDIPNDNVYEILTDRAGDVWVGTDNGIVARLDSGKRTFAQKFDVVPAGHKWSSVLVLRELEDGRFATGLRNGGLSILDPRSGTQEHYLAGATERGLASNMVRTIHQAANGALWVGTDAGLDRIDLRTRGRRHFDVKDGLASRYVDGIVSDANGMLWISTDNGISRLDPGSFRFRTFSRGDGLQSNEFLMRSAYRAPDGSLFFGGNNGFNMIRPELIHKSSAAPVVLLTDLLLFNQAIRPNQLGSPLPAGIDSLSSLQLTHLQNALTFQFTALEYSSPGSVRYAYRLVGFDQEWQEARSQREATYTNLPPGRYTFRVRASNVDGAWNSDATPLELLVAPALWQTLWFKTLVALSVAAFVIWFWRFQRNLTRRKEQERATTQNAQQLRLLIEHTPAAVAMFDRQLRYIMTSRRWLEDYGLVGRQIIGRHHYEIFPEILDMPQWLDIHRRGLAGESFARREDSWLRANGQREWNEWAIHPWIDSQGEVGGIVMFTEVITARKISEQALRTSEQSNRAAMDFAPIGKALVLPIGRFTKVNPALCKLLGYSEEELLKLDFQSITHPDDLERDLEQLKGVLRGELASYEMEKRYFHRDGREIWALLSVAPVRSESGHTEFLVAQVQDISERKAMEHMKSEFISVVSHELRTPLTSIRASLGLIAHNASQSLSPRVSRLVDISRDSCERLVLLVNDILDLDKIASGHVRLDLKTVMTAEITARAIASMEAYATQFDVTIEHEPSKSDAAIKVDPDRFIQILANLLSNAAKFSPRGAHVRVESEVSNGSMRLLVRDRGPGISQEFRSRIFGRFAQAESSSTRRTGGTGLGLHITKSLVEQMNGQIGYQSEIGVGTTFWVEFPLCETGTGVDTSNVVLDR